MQTSIKANDFISVNPVTFDPETDIFDAIHTMLKHKVSGGTVINENNMVVGVLSELDCLRAILNTGYYRQGGGKVQDFMTTENIESMDSHINIVDAAQKLLASNRRRMPMVVNGHFTGQISARSILQAFKDSLTGHNKSEDEALV